MVECNGWLMAAHGVVRIAQVSEMGNSAGISMAHQKVRIPSRVYVRCIFDCEVDVDCETQSGFHMSSLL